MLQVDAVFSNSSGAGGDSSGKQVRSIVIFRVIGILVSVIIFAGELKGQVHHSPSPGSEGSLQGEIMFANGAREACIQDGVNNELTLSIEGFVFDVAVICICSFMDVSMFAEKFGSELGVGENIVIDSCFEQIMADAGLIGSSRISRRASPFVSNTRWLRRT